ncbi:hypothetical protein [Tenacibaculum sp. UWU-22]|uniref:hypothetical protein n=1 Tax=Tenacibaculum sp. UWU-22 TaxID=3234187 RepID=UPI0034DAD22A
MKFFYLFIGFCILLISCNSSDLEKEFPCKNSSSYTHLETTNDIQNLFSISLPKHWKTNLYYDNTQTSIFSADTTTSLTKTTLIDVTLLYSPITFNEQFKQKITRENISEQLSFIKSKTLIFLNKPSYFTFSKGKKKKYTYHILTIYSKVNSENFLQTKIEVYGDSLINERFCKAIKLIEKIALK